MSLKIFIMGNFYSLFFFLLTAVLHTEQIIEQNIFFSSSVKKKGDKGLFCV